MGVSVQPHLLGRVAAYLQSGNADREPIGPFLVGFTPHTTSPWLNYAVPVPGADPTPREVAALVAAFERRGLLPRLEYLPGTAPRVEPALAPAGFTVEGRPPVLACLAGQARVAAAPPGIGCELAAAPQVLRQVLAVQHEAFGEPPPGPHDLDRAVRTVQRGGLVGLAREVAHGAADPDCPDGGTGGTSAAGADGRAGAHGGARADGGTHSDGGTGADGGTDADGGTGGRVVGAGQVTPAADGVAELVGVAVAGPYRRRGIAAAVSAYATAEAHRRGAALVWLEAAGPAQQRVYERAGYRHIGEKLYLSRPR
jgi:ribosomal protein S18 acetylase RimI-like enzyme